jgi:hypothetical protein
MTGISLLLGPLFTWRAAVVVLGVMAAAVVGSFLWLWLKDWRLHRGEDRKRTHGVGEPAGSAEGVAKAA